MVASTGHKEHESEVFGALASHFSAEGAGLAGGPSLAIMNWRSQSKSQEIPRGSAQSDGGAAQGAPGSK